MSAAGATENGGATAGPAGATGMLAQVRARTRERHFWIVQGGVVFVTLLHVAVEASGMYEQHTGPLAAVAHLPILLYLLPVVYAGLRYGYEGGLWTGLSIALLATPNLLFWHRGGWEWIGEALLVLFVVAVGVAVAFPVEREQRERLRAELARQRATVVSRRLALLNDVISTLVRTVEPDDGLRSVLHRTMEVMGLDTAAVITWGKDQGSAEVEACHSVDEEGFVRVEQIATDMSVRKSSATSDPVSGHVEVVVPFSIDDTHEGAVVALSSRPLTSGDRRLIEAIGAQIGVALGRSRLQRAERDALHGYLHAVTRAQEEERRRIARQLHDVATHELLVLRRELETLRDSQMSLTPPWPDTVWERMSTVVACLRRFGRELRPSVLDHLGLTPALGWLSEQADERSPVNVEFAARGQPRRIDPETELALYRIAEEALRNAERHADANAVVVEVVFEPGRVTLEVRDDGCGFAVPERLAGYVDRDGLGLVGMRERAALVGAELEVSSAPGSGTTVRATLPLDDEGSRAPAPEGRLVAASPPTLVSRQ
ncbi:MAG: sensor histidine kinase [Nitriliruptorales bacterium]|nr:sensor histidine kinase [Nitriliruptorales bacterium]